MGRNEKVFFSFPSIGHQALEPSIGHQILDLSIGHQVLEHSIDHQVRNLPLVTKF